MKASWILPFVILGGALQACGAAMNGQLKHPLVNPYLASTVSSAARFPRPATLPGCRGGLSSAGW